VAKDQIELDYNNGVFTVSGERKAGYEKNTETSRYAERSFGRVSRSIRVPASADMMHAKASFDNGVLEVRIPKKDVCENCAMKIPIA
jgi:HSP20 family protein